MTRKWILIQPDGESSVLPVGVNWTDEEPDLATLQEAVGGLIEYAPQFYVQGDINIGFVDTDLFGTEIKMSGKVHAIIMNEESKLPYLGLTGEDEKAEYLKENLNPITQLFQPHDFVLGNAVVVVDVRDEEQDSHDDYRLIG